MGTLPWRHQLGDGDGWSGGFLGSDLNLGHYGLLLTIVCGQCYGRLWRTILFTVSLLVLVVWRVVSVGVFSDCRLILVLFFAWVVCVEECRSGGFDGMS